MNTPMVDSKLLAEQSIDWESREDAKLTEELQTPEMSETDVRQASYLAAYANTGTAWEACKAAEIPRGTVDRWKSQDTRGFRSKLAAATDDYVDMIEAKMRELALEGRNFQAIKAILDAKRPGVWRERQTLDTGTADLLSKLAAQAVPPARKAGEQYIVGSPPFEMAAPPSTD